ncbi:MAG: prepilin-type N-terminal cleavage/methylation domain-containing protein [Colwellia sp.]|nr:prepilin-type N-terminal cleavage/methylation domain-containing protein [Colwellia sp.]
MTLVCKKPLGFTLIELLVVLTISGILIAFVGPVAFEQIDAAKAKSEIEKLKGIIRYTSTESYTQGQSIAIKFKNNQVFKVVEGNGKVNFHYLTFPNQTVFFNRNGYSNQVEIIYNYRDEKKVLDIYNLLGYQDNEFIYAPE